MLKPSDITFTNSPDPFQLRELEDQADKAIRQATADNLWPAVVLTMRMAIDPAVAQAVRQKYRDAGWIVGDAPGSYLTIDHPNRK